MDNKRTILLADANEEFRSMLRENIEKSEEFTVVGDTGDGTEALRLINQLQPDLAMIDLVLPGIDGVGILRENPGSRPLCILHGSGGGRGHGPGRGLFSAEAL